MINRVKNFVVTLAICGFYQWASAAPITCVQQPSSSVGYRVEINSDWSLAQLSKNGTPAAFGTMSCQKESSRAHALNCWSASVMDGGYSLKLIPSERDSKKYYLYLYENSLAGSEYIAGLNCVEQ